MRSKCSIITQFKNEKLRYSYLTSFIKFERDDRISVFINSVYKISIKPRWLGKFRLKLLKIDD